MAFGADIQKARFEVRPLSSEEMSGIGDHFLVTVATRIRRGINVEDRPASSLKAGAKGRSYPDLKRRRGLQPIRDWTFTGRTLAALKVKSASDNRCELGFSNPIAERIAHINNAREEQFGVSGNDRQTLSPLVQETAQAGNVVHTVKAD